MKRAWLVLLLLTGIAGAEGKCPEPPKRDPGRLIDAHGQDFLMSSAMSTVARNCRDVSDESPSCKTARARCEAQRAEFDAAGQAMHRKEPFDSDMRGGWLGVKFGRRNNDIFVEPDRTITCRSSKKQMVALANNRSAIGMSHWSLANEWHYWYSWASKLTRKCELKLRRDEQERERAEREQKAKEAKATRARQREQKVAAEKKRRLQAERELERKEQERKEQARKEQERKRQARKGTANGEPKRRNTDAPPAQGERKPSSAKGAMTKGVSVMDVKDCRYWDARARDARTCAARSRYRGKRTETTVSSGPCDGRVSYYEDQGASCRAREEVGAPGAVAGPKVDHLAPLAAAASKLGELGQHQTRTNLSMIQTAAAQLKNATYSGAQQITNDPLAGLGLEFADMSEVAKAASSWNGAPLTWATPGRHASVQDYCADSARAHATSCKHRCDFYWSERTSDDVARACFADRFTSHFDDQLLSCEGWCDERAMNRLEQCMAGTKLVEVPGGGVRIEPGVCYDTPGLPPREVRKCPREEFP